MYTIRTFITLIGFNNMKVMDDLIESSFNSMGVQNEVKSLLEQFE